MPPLQKFEKHISVLCEGEQPLELMSQQTELSKSQLKQVMHKGAVWITRNRHTQRLRRAKKILLTGDQLHLYYDEKILNQQVTPAQLIADEKRYSIWYKPYGMYSQGSKWGDHCTIQRWVEQQIQQPAFIVHRLDRAATGLIIIAHHKKVAAMLAALFAERKIDKRYRAVVHGEFPASDKPITINEDIEGKAAVSHLTKIQYDPISNQTLLEVKIETGRKHQIRRHLAGHGHPIVGDRLYGIGPPAVDQTEDLKLCCTYLSFNLEPLTKAKIYQIGKVLQPDFKR